MVMKQFRRITLVVMLGAALLLEGCATMGGTQRTVIRAKDKVSPALVHIRPVKEVYSRGKREEVVAIGSGFIISPDGYVCTNEHVAGDTKAVYCVLSDKNEVEAAVVGVDPYTDIAILKLTTDHRLPYVKLGDSSKLKAGQTVMALGSPHGLARSVSLGIVSIPDRHLDEGDSRVSPYNNWIQTDAAINPGNSGGPLVNLRGEVVGVNARMLRGAENVGFAIPINVAKEVADALIKKGRVQRSWLGISLQEMLAKTKDATQEGVIIADVDPLSPAYEAKVQPGDVLISVNNHPVNARFEEDLPAVRKLIADLPVGTAATLIVKRGTDKVAIPVMTEEGPEFRGMEQEFSEWAFTASELTPEIVRRAQLPSRKGVLVSGVQVGGMAGNAKLRQGDIILRVDEQEIENLQQFTQTYRAVVKAKKPMVMLFVKRGALTLYVLVKQELPSEGENQEGASHAE
ncbi:MAG TPA: trypsin-like peptidase domain-containing protein [Candidatus Hydrogenedentes bacterium]|nr:trypsin-like peptidase domain-containing protein [Candidatus Hydrogenedentota bacterium]